MDSEGTLALLDAMCGHKKHNELNVQPLTHEGPDGNDFGKIDKRGPYRRFFSPNNKIHYFTIIFFKEIQDFLLWSNFLLLSDLIITFRSLRAFLRKSRRRFDRNGHRNGWGRWWAFNRNRGVFKNLRRLLNYWQMSCCLRKIK